MGHAKDYYFGRWESKQYAKPAYTWDDLEQAWRDGYDAGRRSAGPSWLPGCDDAEGESGDGHG